MSTHNDEMADRLIEEVARLKAAVTAEHQAANLWRERYERAEADLAAARELLREASGWLGDNHSSRLGRAGRGEEMNCHPETFDPLIPDKERLRYALIDIDKLRSDLMNAYREMGMWKNMVDLCPSQGEIAQLRADLAAARAALAAVSERIDRGYYHTAKALIDAALAGEKRNG